MRALLIDGNNVLARASHAARAGRMALSADGVPTATLLLFVNLLSRYVREVEPTHMVVYWDGGHDFRDAIYPGYKANRKPRAEGEEQIPFAQAKEFLSWAAIPHKWRTGWEADDLIAITARGLGDGQEAVILSGDRDLLQLVTGSVTQIRLPDATPWTVDRVSEEFGYPPHQIPLAKALIGDTGDGVPGVRGIGPKKAVALLERGEWDWETTLGLLAPEQAAEAITMRRLVDLRYLDYAEIGGDALESSLRLVPFAPTGPGDMLWGPLCDYLHRLQMNSVRVRLDEGALWYNSARAETPGDEIFAGFDFD